MATMGEELAPQGWVGAVSLYQDVFGVVKQMDDVEEGCY